MLGRIQLKPVYAVFIPGRIGVDGNAEQQFSPASPIPQDAGMRCVVGQNLQRMMEHHQVKAAFYLVNLIVHSHIPLVGKGVRNMGFVAGQVGKSVVSKSEQERPGPAAHIQNRGVEVDSGIFEPLVILPVFDRRKPMIGALQREYRRRSVPDLPPSRGRTAVPRCEGIVIFRVVRSHIFGDVVKQAIQPPTWRGK